MLDTEQLKIILETFSGVAGDAVVAGITFVVLGFIQGILPPILWTYFGVKVLTKLPKIVINKRDDQ